MRICLMMVDFPDSPAPSDVSGARRTKIGHTKQKNLDRPVEILLVIFDHPIYPGVPLESFLLRRIDGFGARATHDGIIEG